MTVRTEMAHALIQHEEYESAKQVLEKEAYDLSVEGLHLLSLLYQYFDEYDKEHQIIDHALAIDGNNAYWQERLAWHKLPLFDRLVPRKPVERGAYEHIKPVLEVIDNMCFVVGADSGYFTLLVECLESIRHTRTYKDVPICVLDCGLTDEEKHYLTTKLNVAEIKDPGWDVEIPSHLSQPTHSGQKSLMARCHLYKHFPKYKYIFFLDADIWVQDETCLHVYTKLCDNLGFALTANWTHEYVRDIPMFWQENNMIPERLAQVTNFPNIVGGAFLLDTKKAFCLDLANEHKDILKEFGWRWCADEIALYSTMKLHNVISHNQLVPRDIHVTSNALFIKDSLFYSGSFQKPVGLIHLVDNKKDFFRSVPNANSGKYQNISVHYRDWPYEEIKNIEKLLRNIQ